MYRAVGPLPADPHLQQSQCGKREIAERVYDLELPAAARVQWTIGRLIFWSNDVLLHLVGDGFVDTQHAAQFLWEVKDRQLELIGTR